MEDGARTLAADLPEGLRDREGWYTVTFSYDAKPNVGLKLVEPLVIKMGKRQLDGDIPDYARYWRPDQPLAEVDRLHHPMTG